MMGNQHVSLGDQLRKEEAEQRGKGLNKEKQGFGALKNSTNHQNSGCGIRPASHICSDG